MVPLYLLAHTQQLVYYTNTKVINPDSYEHNPASNRDSLNQFFTFDLSDLRRTETFFFNTSTCWLVEVPHSSPAIIKSPRAHNSRIVQRALQQLVEVTLRLFPDGQNQSGAGPLPLAAVSDGGNHGNVLLQGENWVQGAVPRVDEREPVDACTINRSVSIRQPHKTVPKEMGIILDCALFAVNGYCKSQQCRSICTSLRDLESVTR